VNQKIKLPDGREVTIRVQNAESYVPNPQNTNKGKERGKAALDDSLQNSGFHRGIVVAKDGTVINGNHTYQSASELGVVKSWIEVEVEGDVGVVTKRIDWKNAEDPNAILAAIADNRTSALNLEFDPEILEQALQQLEEAGKDIPDTILTKEEIEQLLTASNEWMNDEQNEGLTDPDEIPDEEFTETRVKRGDIWQLGRHRVMCGDSTIITDVERLMDGKKADMVFTDPPYGVDYDGGHATERRREKLANDDRVDMYDLPIKNAFIASADNCALYLWFADRFVGDVLSGLTESGWVVRNWIVWNKNLAQFGAIGAQYKSKHEPCVYCFKKGNSTNWDGPSNVVTVWDMNRGSINNFHPTQKPVELAERSINNHNAPRILDLFLGSGSTLIACEKTGRVCYGMELSERYCDVILKRWEDFTGEKAVLHET